MEGGVVIEAQVRSRRSAGGVLDRAAIMLSGLCVVHCLATTVVVALLASAGGLLLDPRIHETGLVLAVLLGAIALGSGYRAHRATAPLLLGGCGLALMAIGLFVPHGLAETGTTIAGVSILAIGHLRNRRAHAH